MGRWKVSSNVIEGYKSYGVYRIIDEKEVDHSGNRECVGYFTNREEAVKEAKRLNSLDNRGN